MEERNNVPHCSVPQVSQGCSLLGPSATRHTALGPPFAQWSAGKGRELKHCKRKSFGANTIASEKAHFIRFVTTAQTDLQEILSEQRPAAGQTTASVYGPLQCALRDSTTLEGGVRMKTS